MISVKGIGIGEKMAKGRICLLKREKTSESYKKGTPPEELKKLNKAKEETAKELQSLYRRTLTVSENSADIFDIHLMMLEDEDFCGYMEAEIKKGKSAPDAAEAAGQYFSETFTAMDDDYLSHRAVDILDLSGRLCRSLQGVRRVFPIFTEDTIIAADDLTPAETAELDRNFVVGFVTKKGGKNSHTAILAETFGIPALVNTASDELCDGDMAIIDSRQNLLYLHPDEEVEKCYRLFLQAEAEKHSRAFREKQAVTSFGKRIRLYCNINSPKETEEALLSGCDGIGLFRSEFLYLLKDRLPTEEEQFLNYKEVLLKMEGKPVIVRLADIGSDKQLPFLELPEEENPALGLRGIRLGLSFPKILKTQMKALLRASVYGDLSVMLPMVTSVEEVAAAKKIWEEAKAELKEDSIPYSDHIGFGVMVETPAAALCSDRLARECDFLSIGTNDLWQYTMALDRRGSYELNDNDALCRLVRLTIQNGHKAGIWVGVCGSMASDREMAKKFLSFGIDELSVPPRRTAAIKEVILQS